MTAKQYLGRAYRLDLKIKLKLEQLQQLKALATKLTVTLQPDKVSGSRTRSPMEEAVLKIMATEEKLNTQIDHYVDVKQEIAELIEGIGVEEERLLLEQRYLCFRSWEQIAVEMDYCYSYVHRLHHRALNRVASILERSNLI